MKYHYPRVDDDYYNIYEKDKYIGCLSKNFIHGQSDFRAAIDNNSSTMDLREIADKLEELNNART